MTVVFDPVFQAVPSPVIPGQWQTWTIDDSSIVYQTIQARTLQQVLNARSRISRARFIRTPRSSMCSSASGRSFHPRTPIVSYVDAVHLAFDGGACRHRFRAAAVGPTPVPPITTADEYATPRNTPLVVGAASGVLLNDSAQAATR